MGYPQGSELEFILHNIFINDMDDMTECILSKFSDNTKLGGVADTLEGATLIQESLELQKRELQNPASGE